MKVPLVLSHRHDDVSDQSDRPVAKGFDTALAMKVALKVMNVTQDGTIAVPLPAVKREIKYATKLGKDRPTVSTDRPS